MKSLVGARLKYRQNQGWINLADGVRQISRMGAVGPAEKTIHRQASAMFNATDREDGHKTRVTSLR